MSEECLVIGPKRSTVSQNWREVTNMAPNAMNLLRTRVYATCGVACSAPEDIHNVVGSVERTNLTYTHSHFQSIKSHLLNQMQARQMVFRLIVAAFTHH